MTRFAVLASHTGTILQAVLDACADATIDGRVALVISNNSNSGAVARARAARVPVAHLSSRTHPRPEALDAAMVEALNGADVDWVLLAGYMKKLGPAVLAAYRERILNTHPALLPKFGGAGFYGRRVHEAVLASGDRESGATLHLVDGDYDTGPVFAQVRVPVAADDRVEDLEERVKTAERALVVETLARLAGRT